MMRLGLVATVIALTASPLRAQRVQHFPSAAVIALPAPATQSQTPLRPAQPDTYPSTYWKEGGILGAILLGVVGVLLADKICDSGDDTEHCGTRGVAGGAVGAGVGFAIGALIGGQIHKRE